MPPPRKIDLLPKELRDWLQDALKERGFSGYVELAADLNDKLEERGLEVRIGKSAVHAYGQEYEQMARAQEEASAWAVSWMEGNGLEEEAKRHNVLFQMITTLAFKVMKSQMLKEGEEIDPRELAFLGKMLKDVMSSSGMREKMTADQEKRIAEQAACEAKAAVADDLTQNAKTFGLTADTAAAIKARILGVAL
ncbi:hypothetical protein AN189_17865 [Loktanella sp. 3ANDIMAR09]|uniref:phage protein Gp27 family protein n=1 Tax=Loktanella sp. 3ANDIMAR09 TaxID=1225657 RepID=UPI000707AEC9|nr:phage protein Gp27 family protein [Loktanella sp. 3ANDIMAR09]KQI66996.1 hypothetical protein AN189_17865 [Loktanella sp. 3ANDIMAR09]